LSNKQKENILKWGIVLSITLFSIFLFFINTKMPFVLGDDFLYTLQFPDHGFIGSKPIQSVKGYFDSQINHFKNYNNRIAPHAILQLILLLPDFIFDVINVFVFLLLPWVSIKPFLRNKEQQVIQPLSFKYLILYFTVLMFLWCFHYDLGRSYIWTTGSLNYSWFLILQLLYVGYLYNSYIHEFKFPNFTIAIAFLICTTNENVVLSLFAATLIVYIHKRQILKSKVDPSLLVSLTILLLGGLLMLNSPALGLRIENESIEFESFLYRLSEYFKRQFYYFFCGSFALIFTLMYKRKDPLNLYRKKRILFFGSIILISSSIMFLPPLYEPRSSIFAFFILLMFVLSGLNLTNNIRLLVPTVLLVITFVITPERIHDVNVIRKNFDVNLNRIEGHKDESKLLLTRFCEKYSSGFGVCDELSFDNEAFEYKILKAYSGIENIEIDDKQDIELREKFIDRLHSAELNEGYFEYEKTNFELTPNTILTGIYRNENEMAFEISLLSNVPTLDDFGYILRGQHNNNWRHKLYRLLPNAIGKYFYHQLEDQENIIVNGKIYTHSIFKVDDYKSFVFSLYNIEYHNSVGEYIMIDN